MSEFEAGKTYTNKEGRRFEILAVHEQAAWSLIDRNQPDAVYFTVFHEDSSCYTEVES